jgi:basic membrane lipoprotein Med (substrate-binding protein (PBP1-ABC) superfamily)
MKKQSLLILLVVALLAIATVPLLAQESLIESVCLVTDVGKVNDGTFNQFAYEGMMKAVEDFNLDSTYIETQAQTDYDTNLNRCIEEGYDAIVTVGFLLADATRAKAAERPDVYFIGVDQFVGEDADGNPAPSNYVGLQFREDQAGFLAGALAAQLTESGIVGGVYGIDIPPVVKYRNGFEQGAKLINPDIKTLGVYIDSFTAPDRGASAAGQFIGEGADVIFGAGGPTGSGGITRAAQDGALVIGVDQDEFLTTFGNGETPGAENLISSALKRVDVAVYTAIEALVNGGEDFPGGTNLIMSAENDGVGFAEPHLAEDRVPVEVTQRVSEILIGLKNGWLTTGVDPVSGELLPPAPDVAQLQADLEAANVQVAQLTTDLEAARASNSNTTILVLAILGAGVLIAIGAFLGLRRRKA